MTHEKEILERLSSIERTICDKLRGAVIDYVPHTSRADPLFYKANAPDNGSSYKYLTLTITDDKGKVLGEYKRCNAAFILAKIGDNKFQGGVLGMSKDATDVIEEVDSLKEQTVNKLMENL